MKTKYKVLNKDLTSPFQRFKYEIGKEYHCREFDNSKRKHSRGFYATGIEGLPYSFNINRKIFEVEVWGKEKIFDQYKQRFEYQKIIREVPFEEIKGKARELEAGLGYKLSEVLFPINPFLIPVNKVVDVDISNLKKWHSVLDSLVRDSVRDSIWNSVGVYVSSLFPNIKKWKYIDHKEGENPFQPAIDLWHRGFVPSYDGEKWRLHAGKEAKIVYELIK